MTGGMGGETVLCDFRVGKMKLEGSRMSADPRKGKIQVVQCPDGLTRFRWVSRETDASTEDEMIIFPNEAKFEKIPNPNARVFMLKFDEKSRNLYFWMQEPKKDEDPQVVAEINNALGNSPSSQPLEELAAAVVPPVQATPAPAPPPSSSGTVADASTPASATTTTAAAAAASPVDTTTPATNTAVQDTPVAPTAPSKPPTAAGTPSNPSPGSMTPGQGQALPPVQLAQLQSILGSLNMPPPMTPGGTFAPGPLDAATLAAALGGAGAGAMAPQRQMAPGPSLSDVLKPEVVLPLLSRSEVQERLAEFLPSEHQNSEAIMSLVSSPQFTQQLETFSRALQSGQVDLAQFGLNANTGFSVEDFLNAIQAQVDKAEGDAPKDMES